MRRTCVGLALLGLVACHEERPVQIPDLDGRQSALVVATGLDGDRFGVHALALDGGRTGLRLTVASVDRVYLLAYDVPLDALGLEPGPVPEIGEGIARALPATTYTFEARAPERAFAAVDAADLADVFARVRLPSLSAEACSALGCVTLTGPDQAPVCQVPCPVTPPNVEISEVEPAEFASCPMGWERRAPEFDGDVPHCAPPARITCPEGQIQRAGSAACEPLGDCSSPAPATLPVGRPIVYVDDDAAPGGDGNAASPYQTLADAYANAPDGAVIAVYAGRYDAPIASLARDLEIVGNCAAETIVDAPLNRPALDVVSGDVTVRAIALRSRGGAPTVRGTGGHIRLTDVEIDGDDVGIDVLGALLTLERVRILPGAERGVTFATVGQPLVATDVVIEGRRNIGLRVVRAGPSTLTGVVVRGVDGDDDNGVLGRGTGIWFESSEALLRASAVYQARHNAVSVWNSRGKIADVWIEGNDDPPPTGSNGIDAHQATTIDIERLSVRGGTNGLWLYGAESRLTATVTNVRAVDTGEVGIFVAPTTTADVDHVLVRGARRAGIYAAHGELDLEHFTVLETRHTDRYTGSRYRTVRNAAGVRVSGTSNVVAARGIIRGVEGVGAETGEEVGATGQNERFDLRDVTIEDAAWGGIHTYRGRTTAENVVIRRVGFAGLLAYSSELEVADVVLEGVRAPQLVFADDFPPPGIDPVRVDEVRLEYEARNGAGLAVGGFNNLSNGDLEARRVRVVDAARFGIHIANNSRTTIDQVEIAGAVVGEDVAFGGVVDVQSVFFRDVTTPLVLP